MQLEGTAYLHARWNPSGAQIAASVGLGALWFIFGVVKPMVDDLDDEGPGRSAATASEHGAAVRRAKAAEHVGPGITQ